MTTGAGEVGLLRGPADGPACLKLRATPEQTGVEYTSGNAGGMHDCGHEGNLTVTPGAGIPRSSAGTGFTAPPRRFFSPQKKVRT